MIHNNSFPINHFQGSWLLQTNTYVLINKTQKSATTELSILIKQAEINNNILHTNPKQITLNINTRQRISILEVDKNIYRTQNIKLIIKILSKNLFHINYYIIKDTFIYEEYIYIINSNLMVSTGILKNKSNKKYLGITINSYIKLKH